MNNKATQAPRGEQALVITPDTTLGELFATYPQLETVVLELAPALEKLKNPVLRKTIEKVTTLQKVAALGGQSIATVINRLRSEVGQAQLADEGSTGDSDGPEWLKNGKVVRILDARPMLEKGKHPVETVMQELGKLKEGQVYQLITPFLPGPLIDMVKSRGFRTWSRQEGPDLFKNYFAL